MKKIAFLILISCRFLVAMEPKVVEQTNVPEDNQVIVERCDYCKTPTMRQCDLCGIYVCLDCQVSDMQVLVDCEQAQEEDTQEAQAKVNLALAQQKEERIKSTQETNNE